ncbi:hypothetical protein Plhal304r1_c041g0119101 [Plasmopara halstedii]
MNGWLVKVPIVFDTAKGRFGLGIKGLLVQLAASKSTENLNQGKGTLPLKMDTVLFAADLKLLGFPN